MTRQPSPAPGDRERPVHPDRAPRTSPTVPTVAVISAGGVIGALCRYQVGRTWPVPPAGFPWSTLMVNVSGCLLIGVLLTRPGGPTRRAPAAPAVPGHRGARRVHHVLRLHGRSAPAGHHRTRPARPRCTWSGRSPRRSPPPRSECDSAAGWRDDLPVGGTRRGDRRAAALPDRPFRDRPRRQPLPLGHVHRQRGGIADPRPGRRCRTGRRRCLAAGRRYRLLRRPHHLLEPSPGRPSGRPDSGHASSPWPTRPAASSPEPPPSRQDSCSWTERCGELG